MSKTIEKKATELAPLTELPTTETEAPTTEEAAPEASPPIPIIPVTARVEPRIVTDAEGNNWVLFQYGSPISAAVVPLDKDQLTSLGTQFLQMAGAIASHESATAPLVDPSGKPLKS